MSFERVSKVKYKCHIYSLCILRFKNMAKLWILFVKLRVTDWQTDMTLLCKLQFWNPRQKGRDLTQSYDKSPYTHRKTQKSTWQHSNATKNFDYTTIADRLRTVSWGNSSVPIGVAKPVNGIQIVPLTARERSRDLTQSRYKKPFTHSKVQKVTWQHKKNRHQKLRSHNDCGPT